eukprot:CAMPEP_0201716088 /NCGR_PEP_ID=MMETSP0593-20130828/2122_1 /ASSEMBLY_ACC=CAM_ASM_000672 /TAXON_ID=267983 /ORGANISM="Skeletonema japonicum, Strain CCMP2506" /LENGTH=636 /DNA_ID=CAMNT_0048205771 /DNA_START=44 /DNA_END=1954 /DNA_ORIENTATION=-
MKVVALSRLLILLLPVAQAFQLQNQNNNDHHHLVSPLTTHPHHLDQQPVDNIKLLLTTTTKKKKNLLSSSSSNTLLQTAATQINRTVNRNTKNRQNPSKCSLDKPHSTLLDITTSSSSHHDDNNNKKKNIQRSLRQLGITIAPSLLLVTQGRVKVANAAAAAAATPLLVTHPTSISSTAITPLLSTTYFPYHGLTIAPFQGFLPTLPTLPSAVVGEIIMSFVYVILALGVSHALASLAEGGHVKLLRLMAWQNLADGDAADEGSVTSSSASSSTTKNNANNKNKKKGGVNIQGLLSGYTYMVQLIISEIRKAYRIGQDYNKKNKLIPATATTTPMATTTTNSYSSPSSFNTNTILSRYASLLNRSFQEVYNNKDRDHDDHHVKDDDDEGNMNWREYSKLLLKKRNKKNKGTSSRWSRALRNDKGSMVYNKFAMMFERAAAKSDSEAEATKKATDLFQQKQFEQHHHHVHVPRNPFEESSYLDSLAKFGTGDDYDGALHKESPKGYLDTLSEVGKKKSTWDVYKDQVEKAEKEMTNHDEVDYLKEELAHVQSLLQDEQSMYQTSNQALNLVVEAQNEELKHARAATATAEGEHDSTMDELKEFDIKAKEYDEAIKESKVKEVEKSGSANTTPHNWIF